MIGDKIEIKPQYLALSNQIVQILQTQFTNLSSGQKFVAGVGGESGSGKSVTALCIQESLLALGIRSCIIHQDDYFKLAPKQNHAQRLADPSWLGPVEVRLDLIQEQIQQFKAGQGRVEAPLVYYQEDVIKSQILEFQDVQVLIVEGTYILSVEGIDARIFMSRDYHQTQQSRLARGREPFSPEIEGFLKREHEIIKLYGLTTHIIVDKAYQASLRT
jgi:uridine kinase